MAGSDSFTFRQWRDYRESALTIGRVGPWLLYPGIARIEVSSKWKELFGNEKYLTQGRWDAKTQDGPETFPEYLAMIEPGDRERVAEGTKRAFLLNETWNWEATFRRNGLVILARAKAVSPGHVIGVDIDVTAIGNRE